LFYSLNVLRQTVPAIPVASIQNPPVISLDRIGFIAGSRWPEDLLHYFRVFRVLFVYLTKQTLVGRWDIQPFVTAGDPNDRVAFFVHVSGLGLSFDPPMKTCSGDWADCKPRKSFIEGNHKT